MFSPPPPPHEALRPSLSFPSRLLPPLDSFTRPALFPSPLGTSGPLFLPRGSLFCSSRHKPIRPFVLFFSISALSSLFFFSLFFCFFGFFPSPFSSRRGMEKDDISFLWCHVGRFSAPHRSFPILLSRGNSTSPQ